MRTRALGARELSERKVVVRRLASVETLASTTIICSDKTGTLTKVEMTVRKIYIDSARSYCSNLLLPNKEKIKKRAKTMSASTHSSHSERTKPILEHPFLSNI